MSGPTSMKLASPTPVDARIRKKYLIIYFIIIFLSFIPLTIFEYYYFTLFWVSGWTWLFWLLIPFNIIAGIYILLLSSLIVSKIFIMIVNLIHKPKEGIFQRDIKDKDYLFWNIRNLIKKWPLYVAGTNPLPWLKNKFTLRIFGVRIGKNTSCDQCWISSEFITIGNNVICGISSSILSYGIERNKFYIKKINIGDNVEMGSKVVLMPGTQIGENAKISAHSYTLPGQILDVNKNYGGHPANLLEESK